MKKIILALFCCIAANSYSQKEEVNLPQGVVYNYCKPKKFDQAKDIVLSELVLNNPTYSLVKEPFILGPVLWDRIFKVDSIEATESIKLNLHIDEAIIEARYFQSQEEAKVVWNLIRSEFNGIPMRLRKATAIEISYYWTVISYDIDEPLIIAETPERKYILDFDLKTMSLKWLDEMPVDLAKWLEQIKE